MSNQPANSQEKRVKVRLAPESFSDIIFGLALSIGSLILIQNPVSKWQDFSWNVLLFGFSFIVIAMIWLLFSGTICYLSTDSSSVLFLNLVLFFCVALEPYLFYLIMNKAFQGLQSVTSVAYALDVGAMFLVLGTLESFVLKQRKLEEKDQKPKSNSADLKKLKIGLASRYVVAFLFLFSATPVFWISTAVGHLRFVFWYSSFLVFFIAHGISNRKKINRPRWLSK